MILSARTLESKIHTIGITTIQLCYDTYSQLNSINVNHYSELLTVGYNAMLHRQRRLMNHYAASNPLTAQRSYYEQSMMRYVKKRMSTYVNKLNNCYKPTKRQRWWHKRGKL